jgi:sensor domain CHASE-containing protein
MFILRVVAVVAQQVEPHPEGMAAAGPESVLDFQQREQQIRAAAAAARQKLLVEAQMVDLVL